MCKGLDENTKIRREKNSDSFRRIISIQDSSHPGVPTSQGMGHPPPEKSWICLCTVCCSLFNNQTLPHKAYHGKMLGYYK